MSEMTNLNQSAQSRLLCIKVYLAPDHCKIDAPTAAGAIKHGAGQSAMKQTRIPCVDF